MKIIEHEAQKLIIYVEARSRVKLKIADQLMRCFT